MSREPGWKHSSAMSPVRKSRFPSWYRFFALFTISGLISTPVTLMLGYREAKASLPVPDPIPMSASHPSARR